MVLFLRVGGEPVDEASSKTLLHVEVVSLLQGIYIVNVSVVIVSKEIQSCVLLDVTVHIKGGDIS